MDCGLLKTAFTFFRQVKWNLTSLRIQMLWIVTHVALAFLPLFSSGSTTRVFWLIHAKNKNTSSDIPNIVEACKSNR